MLEISGLESNFYVAKTENLGRLIYKLVSIQKLYEKVCRARLETQICSFSQNVLQYHPAIPILISPIIGPKCLSIQLKECR